jgi:hypothetical protein
MNERREREQLLVLVDVDVRRENGDQEGDDEKGGVGPLADETSESPPICDPHGAQLRSSPGTIPLMISTNTPDPTPRA